MPRLTARITNRTTASATIVRRRMLLQTQQIDRALCDAHTFPIGLGLTGEKAAQRSVHLLARLLFRLQRQIVILLGQSRQRRYRIHASQTTH